MPGTGCSSLPGPQRGGGYRSILEDAAGGRLARLLAAGQALGARSGGSRSLCFVTSLPELKSPLGAPFPDSVCWAVCSGRARTLPLQGGQLPGRGEAEEPLEEERERGGKSRWEEDSEERNKTEERQDEIHLCLLLAASLSCTGLQR